ncbi:MAG: hypothetical protein GY696_38395 [Gammaproteobacteria bacterium]|nr:hypothetical protein [Gammaproteobacteria bacterium]
MQNEVVLLELRVIVRDELFLINQGNIESQTKHLQLPLYERRAARRLPRPTCGGTG